MSVITDGA
jgi:hypothetical protein